MPEAPPPPPPALGATVRLHSLVGRPELNGKRGSVVGTLGATVRVSVKIEGEEPIGIKPKNLTVVPAAGDHTADHSRRAPCAWCGATPEQKNVTALSLCARCRKDGLANVVRYCSAACQRSHWPVHKVEHEKIAEEMAKVSIAPPTEEEKRKRAANEKAAEEGDEYAAHLTKGYQLVEAGRRREAAREFRKCVALDSGRPQGHYNLGSAYAASAEWPLALEACTDADHALTHPRPIRDPYVTPPETPSSPLALEAYTPSRTFSLTFSLTLSHLLTALEAYTAAMERSREGCADWADAVRCAYQTYTAWASAARGCSALPQRVEWMGTPSRAVQQGGGDGGAGGGASAGVRGGGADARQREPRSRQQHAARHARAGGREDERRVECVDGVLQGGAAHRRRRHG